MDDFLENNDAAAQGGASFEANFSGADEFSEAQAPQSGFVFMAADTPAPAAAVAPQPPAGGAAATAARFEQHAGHSSSSSDVSPLAEFNKKFREQQEAKDAAERDAKQQRRAAGKAQLKALLAERNKIVEARKAKNRADESESERAVVAAMSAEPWTRVSTLIDVHGHPTKAAASSASGEDSSSHGRKGAHGKKDASGHHEGDVSRMRDVLVSIKNSPPPAAAAK